MELKPLPKILSDEYDKDSLVYISDTEMCYTENFPKEVLNDIINKEVQIFTGYYLSPTRGTKDSPTIFLLGRGNNCGKFKIKVQGFYPYCYIKSIKEEKYDYLGYPVEKVIFRGKEPKHVAFFRDRRQKSG